jgi:ABC-type enterochelin transport system substrate-binding protein
VAPPVASTEVAAAVAVTLTVCGSTDTKSACAADTVTEPTANGSNCTPPFANVGERVTPPPTPIVTFTV